MALKPYQNLSTQASGSITKMRAEQIKSEDDKLIVSDSVVTPS